MTDDITNKKYFKIDDAINCPMMSKTVFIIANERLTKSGGIGRYFTVFPTFKEFLINRPKYPNCHEILVDHCNNKQNLAGRLVFDFDIKTNQENEKKKQIIIPHDFKKQIENAIMDVIERFCHGIDCEKFDFVWSTSSNPTKFSKHLTVKNLYFDDWITMSKIFYKLFCIVWDESHSWIESSKLIDFQIVRKRGSLRMVGSSKINGYPLVMDNPDHKLTDSLIRIYFKTQRETEQLVTHNCFNEGVFENVLEWEKINDLNSESQIVINTNPKKIEDPVYDMIVYEKAYELYNTINPGVFKMGKINGIKLNLIRLKSSQCLLSGKIHDQENAFCSIEENTNGYSVKFGCYRLCHSKKIIHIGCISLDNYIIMIDPDFEPDDDNDSKKKVSKKKKPSTDLELSDDNYFKSSENKNKNKNLLLDFSD